MFSAVFKLVALFLVGKSAAWSVDTKHIYDNTGLPYRVVGSSWFGFETQDFVVNGLWVHPMTFYVNLLASNGFNTLRVPYSSEWALYNANLYPDSGLLSADPSSQHMTSFQLLDKLFDLCEAAGINIMLDLHRLHKEVIAELWYDQYSNAFTADTYVKTWFTMLDRYGNRPNLFAIDMLNEPHNVATWGSNDPSTDWRLFVQSIIPKIEQRYPGNKWIYLVEGVSWGKDLSNALNFPVHMPASASNRLIYSAHVYGLSVVPNMNIERYALYNDWDNSFGNLRKAGNMVVVGEYGGKLPLDTNFYEYLTGYLINRNMSSAFFWSINPNSGDVRGLLKDDWTTIDLDKLQYIHRLANS